MTFSLFKTLKVKEKIKNTWYMAPFCEMTSSQKRWGMARVVRDLTVLPATHAFIRKRCYHAFPFPADAGLHFTDPGVMEDQVDLVGLLHT